MKLSSLTILVIAAPMVLSACQSSQSSISTFSGTRLAGDVTKVKKRNIGSAVERGVGMSPNTSAGLARPNEAGTVDGVTREKLTETQSKKIVTKAEKPRKRVRRSASVSKRKSKQASLFSLPKNLAAYSSRVKSATRKTAKKKVNRKRVAKSKRGNGGYHRLIAKHARANGVPLKLALAVVQVESNFRPDARGRAGEIGLMQIMPRTARGIGYRGPMRKLYHPDTNIRYGMKYLGKAYRLGGGSTCGAILKYNAGHGAKRMNPISRKYCQRVSRIMRRS